jgi:aspartyl-tRNA(Asn)/glutamyl-tRNA(Gln) amidotransferase subunit A
MKLDGMTIKRVRQGLKKKEFSAFELCQFYLKKIKEKDKIIFSFLQLNEKDALIRAKEIDKMIFSGEEIPALAGVVYAVKDIILVEGMLCTAGSKMLENYLAPYDATVIKKIKSQGGIIIGKTNLDEFAMGSSNENSAFGAVKNPHDLSRVPGGSSGGSAAAIAADLSVFALGSDTGGSIREPASFCGVFGLKPTYGAVSRYGLIAFASSLDQIGPIAKSADDCQIVFNAIKGKDPLDSTSLEVKEKDFNLNLKDLKIGIPKEYFVKGIDPEVEKIVKGAIEEYGKMGIRKIEEISLPYTEYALACYYIIASAEASANLAKFDGIKYPPNFSGEKNKKDLLDFYLESRGKGFGPEVKRRIMLGTYALSSGYYDAYYLRAQKVRNLLKKDFEKAFKRVDAIFTPTVPFLPFKIGEKIENPVSMYLADIYTVSVSLAGLPALSLPIGKVGNLPVGLQIIGNSFEENKILEIGKLYKKYGNN